MVSKTLVVCVQKNGYNPIIFRCASLNFAKNYNCCAGKCTLKAVGLVDCKNGAEFPEISFINHKI
jgi:hypothetical protein